MKAKQGGTWLHGLFAGSILMFAACDDTLRASYSTAAATRTDGAVKRGWLPQELPDSAFDITESHDLDSNTGSGSFLFKDADTDSFRAKLQPATPVDVQRLHNSERLRRDGFTFHVVPGLILAVNWQTREVRFELSFNEPSTN